MTHKLTRQEEIRNDMRNVEKMINGLDALRDAYCFPSGATEEICALADVASVYLERLAIALDVYADEL